MDEFEVEAVDLGGIKKMRIGHDSTEKMDAWFLVKALVWEADDQQRQWDFPCDRWFAVDQVSSRLCHAVAHEFLLYLHS